MDKRELVYSLLREVPENRVTTYNELAKAAGTHPRAVGIFMKTNKDPVNIQCFRVVCSNGEIGGYGGGVPKKIRLLNKNGIAVKEGKVDLGAYLHRI